MNYTLNFGRVIAPVARRKNSGNVFRLAVLGDFSGRANTGTIEVGQAIAVRKAILVDVDNLETVFSRLGATLYLPIAADGGAVEVKIESIDDLHPDQLFSNLDFFSELAGLRQRLKNNSTFAAAAKEVHSWAVEEQQHQRALAPAKSRGSAIPQGKLGDFARLLGKASTAPAQEATADELIRKIVAPHIVPAANPEQQSMLAAVDEAISAAMRRILHHPDFQALESLWRSVELLVRELETGPELQIILYDVSAEEIAADLSSGDALNETGLYKLLVEQPEVDSRIGPLSVLVGNYGFEQTPAHAELLGRIGKVAAAAQVPFVAGISTECLAKVDPNDVDLLTVESWQLLRQAPQANYLGLTVPRFMLRWPYGAKTEPIDSFRFEEFTPQFGLKGMLWANGSVLVGLLLAKTFSEQGFAGMQLGSVMMQGDIPFYYYTDQHGDQVALPSTERQVTESLAARILAQNFMPVFCVRGRPEIRLGSFCSLAGADLAGPWAPVAVTYDDEEQYASFAAPDSMSEEIVEASDYGTQEVAETSSDEVNASDVEPPAPDVGEAIDPELAALLAEL